jgi:rifampin ADP-ribosylating transferase
MMSSSQRPDGAATSVAPVPFIVTHPCAACRGQGTDEGGTRCNVCQGSAVSRFFHGTKANLKVGDTIEPGHGANFGDLVRTTTWVYFTGTLDAATWGAELALGDGRGRIFIVEPTGAIEDDPNLTDKKFPGNPTRSYRTTQSLRVVGELVDWQGHSPEQLATMREGLERLKAQGVKPID